MKHVLAVLLLVLLCAAVVPAEGQATTGDDCSGASILASTDKLTSTYEQAKGKLPSDDPQSALALVNTLQAGLEALTTQCKDAGAPVSASATEEATPADGLSMATAFPMGEAGTVLDGQGTLTIERFVRGARSANASFLSYQKPDTNKEWLIVWVTFTCEQSVCDSLEDKGFFLVGSENVIYSNLVYARGGYFDDQLVGQAMKGGKVSGWLWFQVTKSDTDLVLGDNSDTPHFFALYKVSSNGASIRVSAPGSVNLRSCPGTDCAVVGRAANGDQLTLVEDLGNWLHIRTLDGTEGYISSGLVQRN